MKKIILILLLCSLLFVCFFGCAVANNDGEKDPSTNIQDDAPKELDKEAEIVVSLIEYLEDYLKVYDMPDKSLSIKMNKVKNGAQPLHLVFDSSSCYFVCAYYNGSHDHVGNGYCCASEYTWVKFKSEKEITEEYKELKLVVAFRIDPAAFVTNVSSKDAAVPNVEHFQIYTPTFSNGLNTNEPLTFSETFIYLNTSDKNNVYYSTTVKYNDWITIPCVFLDGQYFITVYLYSTYSDGTRSDADIVWEFGEYYDKLFNAMDTEKYCEMVETVRTDFYGVIKIEDFGNCFD